MTIRLDLPLPRRVLAIGAHSDDIEFGCAATLAKWADAGAEVHLCVCTDGSKGTWDASADLGALVARREDEQRDAAKILGAIDVRLLRRVDGELVNDLETRAEVCAAIREVKPDVVVGHDPWQPYRLHPDHLEAGRLAVDGIVAARDPHFFADQDLAPHRPQTLLLFEAGRVGHLERVDGYLDRKVASLLAHRSQWRSTMGIDAAPEIEQPAFVARVHEAAQTAGLRGGLRAAEAFARIDHL
jgi:LmbE family N-acetylglucosaminyl deacetylase